MKIAILGAGASGLSLAGLLSDRREELDLDIEIFEQSSAPLRKVKATGNGRCNFTNQNMGAEYYTGASSAFVEAVIENFSYPEALKFFKELGMPAKTLESGMTYPRTMMSETPVNLLYSKALNGGVKIHLEEKANYIKRSDKGFEIRLENKKGKRHSFYADIVVLSTGGAYGIAKKEWSNGYSLVKDLNHKLTPIHPGIVSLRVKERDICQALSGLKMEAEIQLITEEEKNPKYFSGDLLFTDYGLSGISIFRLSNEVLDKIQQKQQPILKINLFPDISEKELSQFLYQQSKDKNWTIKEVVSGILAEKAVEPLLKLSAIDPESPASSQSKEKIEEFSSLLHGLVFNPIGSRKKDHGQITCGGLCTDQVDPNTMMSKIQPGLFFTGEVLDVQGICGGYNLHWAWASAFRASKGIFAWIEENLF